MVSVLLPEMSSAEMSQDAMSQNPIFGAKKICKHRKDHRRGRRKDVVRTLVGVLFAEISPGQCHKTHI